MDKATAATTLNNCAREPIHALGTIQPFGFLLAVSQDWVIQRASINVEQWLNRDVSGLLGQNLDRAFCGEAIHTIRNRLQGLRGGDNLERLFGIRLQPDGQMFDLALHLSNDDIVIEGESSTPEPGLNSGALVRSMVSRLHLTDSFTAFHREGARQIRMLTGFDRVMIYRFDQDGAGEVIAESLQTGVESFLGLRYPASDIPQQARALYERTWLRIIADVGAEQVAIVPQLNSFGNPLDLSLGTLRSVSPIHIEYLRNMNVGASLSISIMRGGRLWGLIACHHLAPRHVSFERRTAAELFGQIFSLLLESREREEESVQEAQARTVQNKLMATIATEGSSLTSLSPFIENLRLLLRADGVGIALGGQVSLNGTTPTEEEFTGIIHYMNHHYSGTICSSRAISEIYEPAGDFLERAAGMLSIPVSRSARDYIVFFRSEIARTVTWAGNPRKPVESGPNGVRLTPRKSFEAWREVVRGESEPWSAADLRIAESLRVTLLEIVLRLTDQADQERKASHQKQELLIAELNHRVRNILGLVKGLLGQTHADGSAEEFARVIAGRVEALARAHDQITSTDWQPSSLRALVRAEGEAYLVTRIDRIRMEGEDILIVPQAFSSLALVIHEFMTNAAKYGALSNQTGRVTIGWSVETDGRLAVRWGEEGGPPVAAPIRRGFGSTIIERSIPFDLRGEAEIEYALEGVRARFVIPGHMALEGKPEKKNTAIPVTAAFSGLAGAMLVAEDNMIIALDAEDALHDLGIRQIVTVGSVADALRYLDKAKPAAALLDFNLGPETSLAVAERLAASGIPFFFATGYGETLKLPEEFSAVPIIKKPYNKDSLQIALARIMGNE